MRLEFDKNAHLPVTNGELFKSRFAGADAFFALCNVEEPRPGDGTQNCWTIQLRPDAPVLPSRQRKEFTTQFQDGGLRTLGVGSLLWIKQGAAEDRIFLLERNGAVQNSGKWTQPSGLTTSPPLTALIRETIEESGVVAVDHERKSVTVLVPDFRGMSVQFSIAAQALDGIALKQDQERNIRVALAAKNLSDYAISYQYAPVRLRAGSEPPLDRVTLSWPSGQQVEEAQILAYVAKDEFGSLNIHLPIEIDAPPHLNVQALDCEKFGRNAALATNNQLAELYVQDKVTKTLIDYQQRRQCL